MFDDQKPHPSSRHLFNDLLRTIAQPCVAETWDGTEVYFGLGFGQECFWGAIHSSPNGQLQPTGGFQMGA